MPLVRVRVSEELMQRILARGPPSRVVKDALDWYAKNPEKVAKYEEDERLLERMRQQGLLSETRASTKRSV